MKPTGGQIAVRALEAEGIPFTFGIPGTHNIELYDALAASRWVRPILVTDEQSASFMADAVWRASGRMACVNLVPGAGLTHALSGIAEAYLDNVPMLVLGCGVRSDTGFAYQLHDVNQAGIVSPVVKEVFEPATGAEIYGTIRRACALARDGVPGPVFVQVPANLYLKTHRFRGERKSPGDPGWIGAEGGGGASQAGIDPSALARVVELIGAARRTLLYVGAGAAGARARVLALAERLEAPVSTTFQGKGVFPESHPLSLWPGFGDAAPPFAREVARSCDLTLAIGCRFSEVGTGSYGLEPPGPLVHVDIDPEVPGRNYPAEVAIAADAGTFLGALLESLPPDARGAGREGGSQEGHESGADLRETIASGHREVQEAWGRRSGEGGVSPPHLLRTLQELMGPAAVFTADSGNGTFLAVECLRLDEPGKLLAPVDYSCMGYAIPAALGAKLARPDCPVVALAGDGAFLMTGLEILTGVREGLGVIVVVLRDRELAQIAQFQEMALNRKTQSELPDYDLEAMARAVGVPYARVESDDRVEEGVKEAIVVAEQGTPVLLEVKIDYSEKTYFTRGVVKTNLLRLPMKERLRFIGRALKRRLL